MNDIAVLVGTAKGVFVLRSDDRWRVEASGPHLPGEQAYSLAIDQRDGRSRFLAGSTSDHWGSVVRLSDDLGITWTDPAVGNLKFPRDTGAAVEHI